jgi:hypothetical protein
MSTQLSLVDDVKGIIQDTAFSYEDILAYLNEGQKKIAGGILIQYPDRTQVRSSPLPDLSTTDALTSSTSNVYISMPSDYDRDLYFLTSETTELRIIVLSSMGELLDYYPALDNTGQVRFAAIRGTRLYYQGMPSSAESLTAYYFRTPYDMENYAAATISFTASTSTITDSASGFSTFYAGQTIDITGTSNNNGTYTIAAVASGGASFTVDESLTNESAGSKFTIRSRPDGIPVHLHEDLLVNFAAKKVFERKSISDPQKMGDAQRATAFFNQAMLNLEASIERVAEPIQFTSEAY